MHGQQVKGIDIFFSNGDISLIIFGRYLVPHMLMHFELDVSSIFRFWASKFPTTDFQSLISLWTPPIHDISLIYPTFLSLDRTKHIFLKFFFFNTYEHQKSSEIDAQQIHLTNNLAYLFTKSLTILTFKKLIYKIGMRQLKAMEMRGSMLMT